jgi:hypothetical protein
MKKLLLVIGLGLALTACGGNDGDTTPPPAPAVPAPAPTLPVGGTIEGVPAGVDLTEPGTTLEAVNGSGATLATATINADGTFNVTLQEPPASALDIAPAASGNLLSPAVAVSGFDCDSVDFSSGTARGTAFLELEAAQDGVVIGTIRQASDLPVAQAWFNDTTNLPTGTAYINLYVTEPLTIKATKCFRANNINVSFEVVLGQGWNTLKVTKAADGTVTVVRKPDAEAGGKWFFAGQ